MLKQNRRDFLKTITTISLSLTGLKNNVAQASSNTMLSPERMGVLVDTSVCIGCRKCEWACKEAHQMITSPIDTYEDKSVFNIMRRPDDKAYTVVNAYPHPKTADKSITVKVQCMHCDKPACVSACIVGAISKKENGSVVWDTQKCIGCRYCMVACPFQIPAFEYDHAWHPDIRKCDFCFERTTQGSIPACVEICPPEALTYGKRTELIHLAHERMVHHPDKYVNHVYGEFEVGGTSWLYLAEKDFMQLDFPKLGSKTAPGVSESIQHGIFKYFVPPISLYALLGGLMWINKNKEHSETEQS
ncbi:MAG: 4Fe-4S dicluster domain-containing protein [Chlamydiota bacterium]|nr:4Fe-4S dicluster domain-containing protein [Chlamydiota bacterium]